jgi:Mn-containing catalase
MTREITHLRAFMQALESLDKSPLSIGVIPPSPGVVDQYYNDSTGEGDDGEIDAEGPWKTEGRITVVESPALQEFQVLKATPESSETTLDSHTKSKKRRRGGRANPN